jgi:hypothetical protein
VIPPPLHSLQLCFFFGRFFWICWQLHVARHMVKHQCLGIFSSSTGSAPHKALHFG